MNKITGNGKPTNHTPGEVGQYYEDLETGDIYECRRSSEFSPLHGAPVGGYIWELRASGENIREHGDIYGLFIEEPCVKTISYNGETANGEGYFYGWFYKVSDDTPSVEDVLGHVYKVVDIEDGLVITEDLISGQNPDSLYVINNMIGVCREDIDGFDGKGIYFAWDPDRTGTMITEMSYASTKKVINPELIPAVAPSAGGGAVDAGGSAIFFLNPNEEDEKGYLYTDPQLSTKVTYEQLEAIAGRLHIVLIWLEEHQRAYVYPTYLSTVEDMYMEIHYTLFGTDREAHTAEWTESSGPQ